MRPQKANSPEKQLILSVYVLTILFISQHEKVSVQVAIR
jgi:hypothetical protein